MKIAIIGNFDKEISPSASGGTEVFAYMLAEELGKRESIEKVDVYGVGKSHFTQKKVSYMSIIPSSTREFIEEDPLLKAMSSQWAGFLTDFQANLALKSFSEFSLKDYDIIHNNSTSAMINSMMQYIRVPTITTIHTNIDSRSILIPYKLDILQKESNNYFVTIANHQKAYAIENNIHLNFIGTVYNGIQIEKLHFSDQTDNNQYGLWVGRIDRKYNKGLKEALLTSNRIKKPLTVLTSVDDTTYYKEEIEPLLTKQVTFIPENIDLARKNSLYEKASYFLYPIMWEEPFGLVFVEAMAAGTPVIAYARGAVPEIIKDGETGFIVNASNQDIRGDWIIKKTGIDGLCEAVERITKMSPEQYKQMRRNCRQHVEEHFTVERMVDGYEEIYKRALLRT